MLSLIVAMSENRVIGRDGDLPWRLSADLKRFKRLTMGHHIIMGRKTFESIGRPLPGRTSVVISTTMQMSNTSTMTSSITSSTPTASDPEIRVARSLPEALTIAQPDDQPFITGGARVFAESLPLVQRVYLTRVEAHIEGDTWFPDIDWTDGWEVIEQQSYPSDERNEFPFRFITYQRNPGESHE